jgi:N-acyl-D-amino-acid deacylase
MKRFMRERSIPGGALAVVKDRRLVHARGYGWADREKQTQATASSLFRIASLSKPITAVAVLKLVEQARLDLEARVFDLLALEKHRLPDRPLDARWRSVTVRQLLHHTGGWDREKSFDPMFRSRLIARELEATPPARPHDILRYMLGQPLDFDPGTRYAYSNFGYCLLGRVIERVSNRAYEDFVRREVLAPAGATRMRLGASLEDGRAGDEARYYTGDDAKARNVFDREPRDVPLPYGGFCLEAMDAHGGWIASVTDLARFLAALDAPRGKALLRPRTRELLAEPPPAPAWRKPDGAQEEAFYACGWMVRPRRKEGGANWWHMGSLPGTAALLVRRWDGVSYAALFNQRSRDWQNRDAAIDPLLYEAADAVRQWPTHDLFKRR